MYPIMEEILIHTMTYFMPYREADGDTHYDLLRVKRKLRRTSIVNILKWFKNW